MSDPSFPASPELGRYSLPLEFGDPTLYGFESRDYLFRWVPLAYLCRYMPDQYTGRYSQPSNGTWICANSDMGHGMDLVLIGMISCDPWSSTLAKLQQTVPQGLSPNSVIGTRMEAPSIATMNDDIPNGRLLPLPILLWVTGWTYLELWVVVNRTNSRMAIQVPHPFFRDTKIWVTLSTARSRR